MHKGVGATSRYRNLLRLQGLSSQTLNLTIICLIFIVIGTVALTVSRATSPLIDAEAELGSAIGPVTVINDTTASKGKAIGFNNTSTASALFTATSYHNTKLAPDAPLDPSSASVVADLARQVGSSGGNINRTGWTTPVYTVGPTQTTRKVTMSLGGTALQAAMDAVPLPAGAKQDPQADAHLVVWQPTTDTIWEFWGFAYNSTGAPTAKYGGRMQHVSSNPGHFITDGTAQNRGWGATATSIPLLAGLMRINEVKSFRIPHALAMAVPGQNCQVRNPAQRTDSGCTPTGLIPAGARFRLPANIDVTSLGLPPLATAMAKAAQDYGIVVRDKSASVALYAEYSTTDYANINFSMQGFPWSKMQLLPPTVD